MKSKTIGILSVLAVVLAIGWYTAGSKVSSKEETQPQARPAAGVLVGNSLQQFKLLNVEGQEITVGSPDKVTVINFWATWCPPCRAEMPELDLFAGKRSADINFYAINIQETPETISGYLKQNNLTMPVLLDRQGDIARSFRINAIPTTIIADKQGVIRFRKSGPVTYSELEGVIKDL